jgi:hypothetical protein
MSAGPKIQGLPPAELREAVEALWRVLVPGPENLLKLFKVPEFVRLRDACVQLYPKAHSEESSAAMDFALGEALHALGLPGRPPPADRHLALPAGIAAARLQAAFERTQVRRVYLCPLDEAGDLPDLRFGPNRIVRLTAAELEELVDQPRLRRINPAWAFDAKRFSEFAWLVIEQIYPLEEKPAERGQAGYLIKPFVWRPPIEPHRRRYPDAVENAVFAMLLAPWEDWTGLLSGRDDWRPFSVPWVYEIDDDLFVQSSPPPSPASLHWSPPEFDEEEGELPGTEQPVRRQLKPGAEIPHWLSDERWKNVMRALKSPLFETPIGHFFVKAFREDGLDEFVAHLTTIEAALGLEIRGVTQRVRRRISTLLGAEAEGTLFRELYDLRCAFVHGRKMDAIPPDKLAAARRLARKVVNALVTAALKESCPQSREEYLNGLRS